jgi:hypothetical protein
VPSILTPVSDTTAFASYLVRAAQDDTGAVAGTIVRVRGGERIPFRGIDGAVRTLARLLAADVGASGGGPAARGCASRRAEESTDASHTDTGEDR